MIIFSTNDFYMRLALKSKFLAHIEQVIRQNKAKRQ